MTDRELMQQALDAMLESKPIDINDPATFYRSAHAIEALRARLAQPNEPDWSAAGFGKPPQREWVGLTDEEIESTIDEIAIDAEDKVLYPMGSFAHAIEAKLKEKNG